MTAHKTLEQLKRSAPIKLRDCNKISQKSGLYSIQEGKKFIYVGKAGKLGRRLGQHLSFNPRGSMFAYRYMLAHLNKTEPKCGTKEKNKLRQKFKNEYAEQRQNLKPKIAKLAIRVSYVSPARLHSMEQEMIRQINPKLNPLRK